MQRLWRSEYPATNHSFVLTAVYRLRRALRAAGAADLVEGLRDLGYGAHAAPANGMM